MNTRLERTKAKLINQRNAAITKLKVPIPLLKMPTLEDWSYFRIIKIMLMQPSDLKYLTFD